MSNTTRPAHVSAAFDPFAPPAPVAGDPAIYTAVYTGVYAAPVRRRVIRATIIRVILWTLALAAGVGAYSWITAGVFTAIAYAGATFAGFLLLAGWFLLTGVLTVAGFAVYANRVHGHSFR